MKKHLPPEWAPQDAVMLTWPHGQTDWADILDQVEPVFTCMAQHILRRQGLIVVCQSEVHQHHIRELLGPLSPDMAQRLFMLIAPSNDTWARDHGPLTVLQNGQCLALDFEFNAWGNKFASALDNQINQHLLDQEFVVADRQHQDWVLEGGAIEVDSEGHLLTTAQCLLNPNRNPDLDQQQISQRLQQAFGIKKILWLTRGHLEGDDTDAHIDTLVRFAPHNTLVYVACEDETDGHFAELQAMKAQLQQLRNLEGQSFNLLPLPWPDAIYNKSGERLPATYANYLIINDAVLVPTYGDQQDQQALTQIGRAYPDREVIGIDCRAIIEQYGSLHCLTMQLPRGFLRRSA